MGPYSRRPGYPGGGAADVAALFGHVINVVICLFHGWGWCVFHWHIGEGGTTSVKGWGEDVPVVFSLGTLFLELFPRILRMKKKGFSVLLHGVY